MENTSSASLPVVQFGSHAERMIDHLSAETKRLEEAKTVLHMISGQKAEVYLNFHSVPCTSRDGQREWLDEINMFARGRSHLRRKVFDARHAAYEDAEDPDAPGFPRSGYCTTIVLCPDQSWREEYLFGL